MTKQSGVKGKTVPQLHRSQAAAKRKAETENLSAAQKLELTTVRPGQSTKERRRLLKQLADQSD